LIDTPIPTFLQGEGVKPPALVLIFIHIFFGSELGVYKAQLTPMGVLKKSKSINRKGRKEIRKDRKELYYNVLTLRPLRYLCVLCG
jgi:hypothetical protein